MNFVENENRNDRQDGRHNSGENCTHQVDLRIVIRSEPALLIDDFARTYPLAQKVMERSSNKF